MENTFSLCCLTLSLCPWYISPIHYDTRLYLAWIWIFLSIKLQTAMANGSISVCVLLFIATIIMPYNGSYKTLVANKTLLLLCWGGWGLADLGRHWLGCLLHLWLAEVSALPGLSYLCFTAAVLLAGLLILLAEPAKLPEHVLVRMAEVQEWVEIHMSSWGLSSERAHWYLDLILRNSHGWVQI